jgi:predicted anti-sigma-YlaC factor YlaD
MSRPLDCNELVELVTEYFEGVLDVETRTRFEQHIGECRGCNAYVDQIRTTISLTGRVAVDDLSEETKAGLLEAFRNFDRA